MFKLETAFADELIRKGHPPARNVCIKGPDGFRAVFRDTPENRAIARRMVDAANSAPVRVADLSPAVEGV